MGMYEVREGHDSDNREELDELWECVERMKKKIKMFEKVARRLMDGDFGERTTWVITTTAMTTWESVVGSVERGGIPVLEEGINLPGRGAPPPRQ